MANNYIDNKKLYTEMCIYNEKYKAAKEAGTETPRPSEYIGKCIWDIANNLSTIRSFVGYSYRDEMIGDGIENVLRYLHCFDPEKTKNPFAYFTQIIYYAFLRRIDREKKQTYIKYKITEESIAMNTLVDLAPEDSKHFETMVQTLDYTKLHAMADRYEPKKTSKKTHKKTGVENFIEVNDEGS